MNAPLIMLILSLIIIATIYSFLSLIVTGSLDGIASILMPLFNFTLMWLSALLIYNGENNRSAYKIIFLGIAANTLFWVSCCFINAVTPGTVSFMALRGRDDSIGYGLYIALIGFITSFHLFRLLNAIILPRP